jgi:hypothetical protein
MTIMRKRTAHFCSFSCDCRWASTDVDLRSLKVNVVMVRRGISIVVLLGYLAGQLVVIPHAHAGQSPHGHRSLEPHVHLSASVICHQHQHSHSTYEHGHSHHAKMDSSDGSKIFPAGIDHDADAVYVSTFVQATRRTATTSTIDAKGQLPAAFAPSLVLSNFNQAHSTCGRHYPNTTEPHCALFLTLGSLRI